MTLIASTMQSFFTDRLAKQREASARTIVAYRDSLRLLVVFVHHRTGKASAARARIEHADDFIDTVKWRTGTVTALR
jgi:site-specific recombinase XerD